VTKEEPRRGATKSKWRPEALVRNAIALIISSGGSAVVGIVFWIVAARIYTTAEIGKATAEIAAMLLLATLAQLSFGSIFERFLPVAGANTHSFVRRAYVISVLFGLVLAVVYVTLHFGSSFLPNSLGWKVLFVTSVVLWTIFALQDSVLIGLRSSPWVAVENIAFGVVKLLILPLGVVIMSSQGIFLAWTAPVLPAIVAVSWYLFRHRIPQHTRASRSTESLPSTRSLFVLASAQYASLLTSVFLPSIVTLIVIQRLGPVANAHYYLPSMIFTNLGQFFMGIVRSFLVEATGEPTALRRHANSTIRALIVVLVPSVVLGFVFAPDYLRLFGTSYATHGTTLMRMLLISLLGSSVMMFYSAFAWLDQRVWWMTARNVASSLVFLALVYGLIGHLGINAIGVAMLANSAITFAIFLPISIRRYKMT
jgi:O-antigen/teichoic acid export membrane protein